MSIFIRHMRVPTRRANDGHHPIEIRVSSSFLTSAVLKSYYLDLGYRNDPFLFVRDVSSSLTTRSRPFLMTLFLGRQRVTINLRTSLFAGVGIKAWYNPKKTFYLKQRRKEEKKAIPKYFHYIYVNLSVNRTNFYIPIVSQMKRHLTPVQAGAPLHIPRGKKALCKLAGWLGGINPRHGWALSPPM
jgi:hypothetical protein